MGFFSWQCKGCDQSVKAPYNLDNLAWQSEAVFIDTDGTVYSGEYDGYGRIDHPDLEDDGDIWGQGAPELWHKLCWEASGEPSYSGPSEQSQDQGYFFDYDEELEGSVK